MSKQHIIDALTEIEDLLERSEIERAKLTQQGMVLLSPGGFQRNPSSTKNMKSDAKVRICCEFNSGVSAHHKGHEALQRISCKAFSAEQRRICATHPCVSRTVN